jgi:antibiotic biosynthesis monooxygenase (ABM) superfamily enzyme
MTDKHDDGKLMFATPDSRASAIIVQRIAPDKTDGFVTWQRGIAGAAAAYAGYERTEVFPPHSGSNDEWVTIIHFKGTDHLEQWLKSDVRAQWNRKFVEEFGEFEIRKLGSGLGILFPPGTAKRPAWKSVLIVVAALYPSLMVLNATAMKPFHSLSTSTQMLIGNFMSVSLLQWVMIPLLTKLFSWWLYSEERPNRQVDVRGAALILGLLGILTVLFNGIFG